MYNSFSGWEENYHTYTEITQRSILPQISLSLDREIKYESTTWEDITPGQHSVVELMGLQKIRERWVVHTVDRGSQVTLTVEFR